MLNNAGPPIKGLERQIEWSDEQWHSALELETFGALRMFREFSGRVINTAGASGTVVWRPALLPSLGNAAILHMTGFMAADLAPSRITVNAIVPEVADPAVFLASDRAGYITGAKIPIDGGLSVNSR